MSSLASMTTNGRGVWDGVQLRVLLSYHYYKDVDLDAMLAKHFSPPYPDLFADSGAYSAKTLGVAIDIAEYAAWIKRWEHLLTTYSNLDDIGNAEGTHRNQRILEDRFGLTPLPVFHTGEPWSVLEGLIREYPYIALGGMVGRRNLMPWLVRCFKLAGADAVFHGFGMTSWNVIKSLRWYSVDSSSWGSGFRFGRLHIFNQRVGGFVSLQLGNPKSCHTHAKIVRALGFDPNDFSDPARYDRAKVAAISALSYMKAEQWLRVRLGEVHIPRSTMPAGVEVFGALPGGATGRSGMSLPQISEGLKLHLVTASSDGSNQSIPSLTAGLKLYGAGSSAHSVKEDAMSIPAISDAISKVRPPGPRIYLAEGGGQDSKFAHEVLNG